MNLIRNANSCGIVSLDFYVPATILARLNPGIQQNASLDSQKSCKIVSARANSLHPFRLEPAGLMTIVRSTARILALLIITHTSDEKE
jgi:hypothetical protein